MKRLSTGDPSTLRTYKMYAQLFGDKAVTFIQNQIDEAPEGEDEIVLAAESQMLILLASMKN